MPHTTPRDATLGLIDILGRAPEDFGLKSSMSSSTFSSSNVSLAHSRQLAQITRQAKGPTASLSLNVQAIGQYSGGSSRDSGIGHTHLHAQEPWESDVRGTLLIT